MGLNTILQITQIIDEDTGEVKDNVTTTVAHRTDDHVAAFKTEFKNFGEAVTKKAKQGGVPSEHIRTHHQHGGGHHGA